MADLSIFDVRTGRLNSSTNYPEDLRKGLEKLSDMIVELIDEYKPKPGPNTVVEAQTRLTTNGIIAVIGTFVLVLVLVLLYIYIHRLRKRPTETRPFFLADDEVDISTGTDIPEQEPAPPTDVHEQEPIPPTDMPKQEPIPPTDMPEQETTQGFTRGDANMPCFSSFTASPTSSDPNPDMIRRTKPLDTSEDIVREQEDNLPPFTPPRTISHELTHPVEPKPEQLTSMASPTTAPPRVVTTASIIMHNPEDSHNLSQEITPTTHRSTLASSGQTHKNTLRAPSKRSHQRILSEPRDPLPTINKEPEPVQPEPTSSMKALTDSSPVPVLTLANELEYQPLQASVTNPEHPIPKPRSTTRPKKPQQHTTAHNVSVDESTISDPVPTLPQPTTVKPDTNPTKEESYIEIFKNAYATYTVDIQAEVEWARKHAKHLKEGKKAKYWDKLVARIEPQLPTSIDTFLARHKSSSEKFTVRDTDGHTKDFTVPDTDELKKILLEDIKKRLDLNTI
ncbi:hypothetical protein NEHOM01_1749 [Nematocida homosporus]|uniref:uncharacterized protein n=1 Tax=Nematocida homosporus TaxID=1912981 RepID=UPI00221FE6B8|nr:uncharacterized protein NEHOM01_1749 [Nematocida homosporus]KAI5186854.1 hypothetical protein NEHOM01_1749 [Nematocida homosporus]